MPTRRKSKRLMTDKEAELESTISLKAIEDKAAKEKAQLKSIDALIDKLSPGKLGKTRRAFKRLHSAHKTRIRARTERKELQKLKAMATRAFKKRAKSAKLDKENTEVASILMDNRFPMDVALMVAKDRHDLQKRDRKYAKKVKDYKTALMNLQSQLPRSEERIRRYQDDIDGMLRRNVTHEWVSRYGHRFANSDGWLHITLSGTRRALREQERELQELKKKVVNAEAELRAL